MGRCKRKCIELAGGCKPRCVSLLIDVVAQLPVLVLMPCSHGQGEGHIETARPRDQRFVPLAARRASKTGTHHQLLCWFLVILMKSSLMALSDHWMAFIPFTGLWQRGARADNQMQKKQKTNNSTVCSARPGKIGNYIHCQITGLCSFTAMLQITQQKQQQKPERQRARHQKEKAKPTTNYSFAL